MHSVVLKTAAIGAAKQQGLLLVQPQMQWQHQTSVGMMMTIVQKALQSKSHGQRRPIPCMSTACSRNLVVSCLRPCHVL